MSTQRTHSKSPSEPSGTLGPRGARRPVYRRCRQGAYAKYLRTGNDRFLREARQWAADFGAIKKPAAKLESIGAVDVADHDGGDESDGSSGVSSL